MIQQDPAKTKQRAEVIKAIAHPSRLMMLQAMEEGELCVCKLQELVGSDISTVSKHLSILKSAGLVVDRKQGQQVFYSLRIPCLLKFLSCIDDVLNLNK